MVTPKKKARIQKIVKSYEAVIFRLPKESPKRRILRKTHTETTSKKEHPKIHFYSNLIAKLIFPKNAVHFSMVRVPKKWKPEKDSWGETHYPKGIEFYSEEIPTSKHHQKYREAFYKRHQTKKETELIEEHKRKIVKEITRPSSKIAAKIKELRDAGFFVNINSANIDLVKETPVFFEIQIMVPARLERFIQRKKTNKTFTKAKKARALRLIKRLKAIWKETK